MTPESAMDESVLDSGFRRLSQDDLPKFLDLRASVGWSTPLARTQLYLRVGQTFGYLEGDILVASTTVFTWSHGVSSIANVIVHPSHQRRGIGRRLLTHALAASSTSRAQLVATKEGRPLYVQLGFQTVQQVIRFERSHRPDAIPNRHSATMERELSTGRPISSLSEVTLTRLIDVDEQVHGYRRDELFRALHESEEAFLILPVGYSSEALEDFLDDLLHTKRVSPASIAVCSVEGDTLYVGPVLALHTGGAVTAISSCAKQWSGNIRIEILQHQKGLIDILPSLGFTQLRSSPLMQLGFDAKKPIGDEDRHFTLFDAAFC